VIASAQPPFSPATDTSIVVTGMPGAQTALVFADNNLPGTCRQRADARRQRRARAGCSRCAHQFCEARVGLATNTASSYIELVEDTYTIDFDLAGTTTSVLNMTGVAVTAGRTYTLYLMGTPGALAGVLTRDD
jgi:hypothetical protein